MKNKYYKSLPNSLAKTRITKLVEAHEEAWEQLRSAKRLGAKRGHVIYDLRLAKAIGYSEALKVMGIVEIEGLES